MKILHPRFLSLVGMMAVLTVSSRVQAVQIAGVTIADVSSELGGPSFDRAAVHLIDGSGLDPVTGFHTNAPDAGGGGTNPGSMWLTNGVFAQPNDPLPAHVTFNLAANYDLESIRVWNYNETRLAPLTGRGANRVEISVADSEGGAFTLLGGFSFNQATGSEVADFSQTIDLSSYAAADNARLVRFDILSNHGGDNEFAGLSEVQFNAVPEPAGLSLFALGLAGWAARLRRR